MMPEEKKFLSSIGVRPDEIKIIELLKQKEEFISARLWAEELVSKLDQLLKE